MNSLEFRLSLRDQPKPAEEGERNNPEQEGFVRCGRGGTEGWSTRPQEKECAQGAVSRRKATRKVTVVTNVRAEGEEPTEVRLATITEYVCLATESAFLKGCAKTDSSQTTSMLRSYSKGKGHLGNSNPVLWISSFAIEDLCLSKFSQGHGQLNETIGRKTLNCFSLGCGNSEEQTVPNWKRPLPLPNPTPHSPDGRNKEYAASCLLTEGQPEVGPAVLPPTRGSLCVSFAVTGVLCAERHTPPHRSLQWCISPVTPASPDWPKRIHFKTLRQEKNCYLLPNGQEL